MKFLIIIPAYNEEENIGKVLDLVHALDRDILVIDNASTDNTAMIAKKKHATLIVHKENLGKAASLIEGFNYAVRNKYDAVICMDGDGEHNSAHIKEFIGKIGNYDIVIGEREYHRSFSRRMVNFWSSLWFGMVLTGIKDTQCGFRAIRTDLLKKMRFVSNGFEIEIEILLEAAKNNARIGKVQVKSTQITSSKLGIKDYVKINNFFDRWVLSNISSLKINLFKKAFLFLFANIGLFIFRWFE